MRPCSRTVATCFFSTTGLELVAPRTTADSDFARDVPDFWATTSREEIEETTRFVVGPDEPFGGRSQEDMERDHWAYLAGILRQQGVAVRADELKGLRTTSCSASGCLRSSVVTQRRPADRPSSDGHQAFRGGPARRSIPRTRKASQLRGFC